MFYEFETPSSAFLNLLEMVVEQGKKVTVRGQETKELLNVSLTIHKPWQRCLVIPQRHDNIFAKIAETLWVLAGRNDIEWLSYYLPRAVDWADDGKHWRAGYGPRLRSWEVQCNSYGLKGEIDQVEECLKLLQVDPTTRRAVMSLWNPVEDYKPTLDTPCNNWLHWIIRDGKLLLNIAQRSSDILWGFSGINLFEWSVLQEYMAHWLGIEPGTLTYNITSLHLYDKHYKRADEILESCQYKTIYDAELNRIEPTLDSLLLDSQLAKLFEQEAEWRIGGGFKYTFDCDWLDQAALMLFIFISDKITADKATDDERVHWIANDISLLEANTEFRMAAIEYYGRKFPELYNIFPLTATERLALQFAGIIE